MDEHMRVQVDCQVAVALLLHALEAQGMRIYCSFNLRTALAGLSECGCPHHGTRQCTCQYAVLLVYGDAAMPARVVAHGRDGWVHLSLPDAGSPSATFQKRVFGILLATLAPYLALPQEPATAGRAAQTPSSAEPRGEE